MNNPSNLPPPAKAPSVLFGGKNSYKSWLNVYKKFPKPERFGLGYKIDCLFIELLENLLVARYASPLQRTASLELAISKIDKIKFLLEIAWENKLLASRQHGELLDQLQSLGRMLGGWKKGIDNKNSRT